MTKQTCGQTGKTEEEKKLQPSNLQIKYISDIHRGSSELVPFWSTNSQPAPATSQAGRQGAGLCAPYHGTRIDQNRPGVCVCAEVPKIHMMSRPQMATRNDMRPCHASAALHARSQLAYQYTHKYTGGGEGGEKNRYKFHIMQGEKGSCALKFWEKNVNPHIYTHTEDRRQKTEDRTLTERTHVYINTIKSTRFF